MKTSPSGVLPVVPFPNLYWMIRYLQLEVLELEVFENYIKQSGRNRYEILNAQGRQTLSIPVVGQKGEKIPVSEISIAHQNWKVIHWRSIVSAYNSSPFFLYYQDDLEALFEEEHLNLTAFNLKSLDFLLEAFGMIEKHKISEKYCESSDTNFSPDFKPVNNGYTHEVYHQVFSDRLSFEPNLSTLDLLFNKGPESLMVIKSWITSS